MLATQRLTAQSVNWYGEPEIMPEVSSEDPDNEEKAAAQVCKSLGVRRNGKSVSTNFVLPYLVSE